MTSSFYAESELRSAIPEKSAAESENQNLAIISIFGDVFGSYDWFPS